MVRKYAVGRHVARMGERSGAYRVLVGIREGKRRLGRPGRGWEDCMKLDVTVALGRCILDWSGSNGRLL
jgi:hypothetical protein